MIGMSDFYRDRVIENIDGRDAAVSDHTFDLPSASVSNSARYRARYRCGSAVAGATLGSSSVSSNDLDGERFPCRVNAEVRSRPERRTLRLFRSLPHGKHSLRYSGQMQAIIDRLQWGWLFRFRVT